MHKVRHATENVKPLVGDKYKYFRILCDCIFNFMLHIEDFTSFPDIPSLFWKFNSSHKIYFKENEYSLLIH